MCDLNVVDIGSVPLRLKDGWRLSEMLPQQGQLQHTRSDMTEDDE